MEPFQLPTGAPSKKGETYTFSNGATYVGVIRNGKMHGEGRYNDPSGGFYEGQWKDGIMHGRGRCIAANGEKYEGEYIEGLPHGRGTYNFQNGNIYEGEYVRGKIEGHGVIRFPDRRRFEGAFKNNKKHGRGRYEGATGIYEGEYQDGKKEGRGTFTWIDGGCYEGGWCADFMHGEDGIKRESDGSLYRVHHDMGKLISATPLNTPHPPSLSAGGFDSFSVASMPQSFGLDAAAGRGGGSLPPQPTLDPLKSSAGAGAGASSSAGGKFSRTLNANGGPAGGPAGGDGGDGGDNSIPTPLRWLRDKLGDLADAAGCGGARVSDGRPGLADRLRDCGGCGHSQPSR